MIMDCRGCFRSLSNFVVRIVAARTELGKPSFERWFNVSQALLPATAHSKEAIR
jgi:hypothetical protein